MKLTIGIKLFISYFVLSSAIIWFVTDKLSIHIPRSIDEVTEELMIDTSNLLAEMVSTMIVDDKINLEDVRKNITTYLNRDINANIFSIIKKKPNLQLYITNKSGIVIFDSRGQEEGADYSRWIDVSFTLKGEYGSRVSPDSPISDEDVLGQESMYVAAPIYHKDTIWGVLTIIKSMSDLTPYALEQRRLIQQYSLYIFLLSLLAGATTSYIVSRNTNKLVKYVTRLSKGENIATPEIRQVEFQELSHAIGKLRTELEGREYVEEFINTMAHELRTPITGIRATAENLLIPMDDKQREHFIRNILDSNERMELLVNRLLELSHIERRYELGKTVKLDVHSLIEDVMKAPSRIENIVAKNLNISYEINKDVTINVERLLAEQAIGNIIDNAIDFSPKDSVITIKAFQENKLTSIQISDQGPGIPENTKSKLFSRFFSSPRPDTGKYGNGLGLRFVKTIMELHGGKVSLNNRLMENGMEATLSFPPIA